MIKEGSYVYIKCLVTSAMPLGPIKTSDELIEPDVVDVIPVNSDGNIIKRFLDKPISFLIENVMEVIV